MCIQSTNFSVKRRQRFRAGLALSPAWREPGPGYTQRGARPGGRVCGADSTLSRDLPDLLGIVREPVQQRLLLRSKEKKAFLVRGHRLIKYGCYAEISVIEAGVRIPVDDN
jgi:hypothetical protein